MNDYRELYECLPEVMVSCPARRITNCVGQFWGLHCACAGLNQEATRERARREAVLYGIPDTGHQGDAARAE
jgi:hypothetical protein